MPCALDIAFAGLRAQTQAPVRSQLREARIRHQRRSRPSAMTRELRVGRQCLPASVGLQRRAARGMLAARHQRLPARIARQQPERGIRRKRLELAVRHQRDEIGVLDQRGERVRLQKRLDVLITKGNILARQGLALITVGRRDRPCGLRRVQCVARTGVRAVARPRLPAAIAPAMTMVLVLIGELLSLIVFSQCSGLDPAVATDELPAQPEKVGPSCKGAPQVPRYRRMPAWVVPLPSVTRTSTVAAPAATSPTMTSAE